MYLLDLQAVEELPELGDQLERHDSPESDAASDHSSHNTNSEQSHSSISEVMDETEPDPYVTCDVPKYYGKDKVTEWLKHVPSKIGRTRKHNITTHLPGVKSIARDAKSPLECWQLFFPDSAIQEVVDNTNIYLTEMRKNYGRERDCSNTSFDEIRALIGLLYLAGVKKSQHLTVAEMWSEDGTAPECFRATMSNRRFYQLLRALRFDDIGTRNQRKTIDNLAAIRKQFEEFVARCKANYQIGEYATVDEMLEAFRGRCKFRQYIANKPAKYGIKIYALVDARTFYTSNLEIYAGQQPDGPYKLDNRAASVVKRIITPILNTGRNVTMDNYFTSVPLAQDLVTNHRTTIVGTLRKNKREIPPELLDIKVRPPHSSMFAFSKKNVLVSYVPRKGKNVLLLSTMHDDDAIDPESGSQTKPEIITFYNLTKGAVDVVDEMKSLYSVSRITCRWPLRVYFSMLNISGVNSYIVHKANNNEPIGERRVFLKELALSLVKPHLVNRSKIQNIPLTLRTTIARIAGVPLENPNQPTPENSLFCYLCPRRKNRKTKKNCNSCNRPICPEHSTHFCPNCLASPESSDEQ